MAAIERSSFVIAANGAEDSPPGSALRDFLVAKGADVTTVWHPLSPEDGDEHRITTFGGGEKLRARVRHLPTKPPYTYPVDAIFPGKLPKADVWFGFNNLLAARGIAERRRGRADQVVYWAVDFVPERFGPGVLTRIYDGLDRWVCGHADHRVEISAASLAARDERHGINGDGVPSQVVGIGAWLDRVPTIPENGDQARRAVFIGHLVPRMGIELAVDALALLAREGVDWQLDIAGRGPSEDGLREKIAREGLADRVTFHGFISDHRELERLLVRSSVALAPYAPDPDSFTRFADPSKLKSYAAAGLPIVLTDVPPNARELAARGGAELVEYTPRAVADAIARGLAGGPEWRTRRAAALDYAQGFDWGAMLAPVLARMGFSD